MFMDEFGNKFGLDPRQTVAEFRKAIEAGIPKDDELRARLCIGKNLDGWARSVGLEVRKWLALAETEQALSEMEQALEIDRDGGFGFFSEPKNRYQLRRLDNLYAAKGAMISIEKGHGDVTSDAAAVEYWDSKLPRCAYLPSTPLLVTMSDAGFSYSRMGMRERAIQCFQSVLTAAPVDPFDEDGFEAGLRQKAKTCLRFLYEQDEQ
jgi:tetratricopeptide (TPR) repeat protein